MSEVWVAETWQAHGEGACTHGVYDSREAAFEALKALPNMTVYVDDKGIVQGRPRKERQPRDYFTLGYRLIPQRWAVAAPWPVQQRREATQAPSESRT